MRLFMRNRSTFGALMLLVLVIGATAEVKIAEGAWLSKVPVNDREKPNPFHDREDAVAAGKLLFADHCASCHGKEAMGNKKHPSLRTERVQQATDGELHWLLQNGEMSHGMPSWARLGDPRIWQLVTYLKTLH